MRLIGLNALDDLLLALARLDVRGGDVKVLSDDAAVDVLVNGHTHCALVDVENNTCSAVVVLEGHTLVDGRVDLDIDEVSSLHELSRRQVKCGEVVWKMLVSEGYG